MNIIFLGRSELPKKEKDTEEHQSFMDVNLIDKGFYFVLLWSAVKSFVVLFDKNFLIKMIKRWP